MHQMQPLKLTAAAIMSVAIPMSIAAAPVGVGQSEYVTQDSASGSKFEEIGDATIASPEIDLCQQVLTASQSEVVVSSREHSSREYSSREQIVVFNGASQVLPPRDGADSFSFSGNEGDIFFMAVSGVNPIINETFPLTFVGWDADGLASPPAFISYETTLQNFSGVLPVAPDPAAVLGLALMGGVVVSTVVSKHGYRS